MKNKKVLLPVLFLVVLLLMVSCGKQIKPVDNEVINQNSTKLNVRLMDNMTLSGIETIKNSLYTNQQAISPSDEVWTIIETDGISLIDAYYDSNYQGNFRDFALSVNADNILNDMLYIQNNIKDAINGCNIEAEYSHTYTTLFSGFAAKIKYGEIKNIENIPGVKNVIVSQEYAACETVNENISELITSTGSFKNDTEYQGEGMLIAVVDNGLDYTHSAFQTMPEEENLTQSELETLLSSLWAKTVKNKNFTVNQIYKSKKIPYQFDYSTCDADVKTKASSINNYGSYHGTHVSGIAVGDDEKIKGSAPKAQLAFMKVFRDNSRTSQTTDIIAALGDCALLGVDAINMSLGSPAGFTEESAASLLFINETYRMLEKLGILVICSAGNDANTSFAYENLAISVLNPDSGLLSSPSSYDAAYSVASVNAYTTKYLKINDVEIIYNSAVNLQSEAYDIENIIFDEDLTKNFDIVKVPGFGQEKDYENLDVNGKAVLVSRGEISFEEKQKIAANMGASIIVIYNNVLGNIGAQIENLIIPTITISNIDYLKIANSENLTLTFNASYEKQIISSFSSWGPTADLTLKPDITAPGGMIYSSMPNGYKNGLYGYLSGTSMAAPNMTGLITCVKQYIKGLYPSYTEAEVKDLAYQLIQSTATLLTDNGGNYTSPRAQGAGVANINNAVKTKAYLSVTGTNRTKIELGDDKNKDGIYTLSFNITNFGTEALSYNLDVTTLTETLNPDNSSIAIRSYLLNKGSVKIISNIAEGNVITIEAGKTESIKVVVTLAEEEKTYLNNSFPNGMFIEGFVELHANQDESVDLSIPFLGFYGDWTQAPIFDKTEYDEEAFDVYGSMVYGYYGMYNSYYPMGAYKFFNAEENTETPKSDYNRIAMTNNENGICSIYSVYLGSLRNIKKIEYRLYDSATNYTYYTYVDYNTRKMYINNAGSLIINGHELNIEALDEKYEFSSNQILRLLVTAYADYEGEFKKQTMEFPVYLDFERPILNNVETYTENDRLFIDLEVYENHIVDNLMLGTLDSEKENTIKLLNNFALPVVKFNQAQTNTITIDITDYVEKLNNNELYVCIDDCAHNQAIYKIDVKEEIESENTEGQNTVNSKLPENEDYNSILAWAEKEYSYFNNEENYDIITTYAALRSAAMNSEADIDKENYSVYSENEHKFTVNDEGVLIKYEGPGGDIVIPGDLGIKTINGSTDVFKARKDITSVKLPEGVNSIMDSAFAQCTNLKSVELPASITKIASWAFGQSGIESIKLPENLKEMSNSMFNECLSLSSIEFPANITGTIGKQCFFRCIALNEITLPDGITVIDEQAFVRCETLKKVTLSKNTTDIKTKAFMACFELEQVNFEELTKITTWPVSGFAHCNLKNIIIPKNEQGKTVKISMYAFEYNLGVETFDCYANLTNFINVFGYCEGSLKSVNFYGNITGAINGDDFIGAYNLETVNFYGDVNNVGNNYLSVNFSMSGLKSVHFYGNVNSIKGMVFSNCKNLNEVVFHKNLNTLDCYAFGGSKNLKHFSISDDNEYLIMDDETKLVYNKEKTKVFAPSSWDYDGILELPETLENNEFLKLGSSHKYFALVTFSRTISETMVSTVLRKSSSDLYEEKPLLKGLIIPASITSIPDYSFRCFTNLKSVEFKGAVTDIGDKAFENCGIEELILPDSVTYIGGEAFNNNINLKKVNFGKAMETISYYAFYNCKSLTEIILPETLKSINDYAFADTALESLYIPGNVTYLNPFTVFSGVNSLKSIEVNENNNILTSENNCLFDKNKTALYKYASKYESESFVVPETVTTISELAFYDAIYLKSIELNNTINIEDFAFYGSAIENITLGQDVNYIGRRAFGKMNINKLILGSKVQVIDYGFVFYDTAIKDIEIKNSEYFIIKDNFLMNMSETVIFDYLGNETETLVIPEGVTRISPYAFKNAEIKELVLPSTLQSIGSQAFYGCKNLTKIEFKSEVAPRLECEYDGSLNFLYMNFNIALDEITENTAKIQITCPKNNSYLLNFIYNLYFEIIE